MTTETRLSAPSTGRPAARQILFAALSESGSLSRADLARRTGLAASTVSTVTAELIRDGLVGEFDRGDDSDRGARGGRPPTLLALNRSAGLVIGIDFGKQHLRVAVADRSHDLVAERVRRVAPERRASTDVRWAVRLVHDALDEAGAGIDDVVGIGMGLPGPIHGASGEVGDSTILPGWVGVPAAEAMSEALEHPVLVENDANLGASSEWMWGAGPGVSARWSTSRRPRVSARASSSTASPTPAPAARPASSGTSSSTPAGRSAGAATAAAWRWSPALPPSSVRCSRPTATSSSPTSSAWPGRETPAAGVRSPTRAGTWLGPRHAVQPRQPGSRRRGGRARSGRRPPARADGGRAQARGDPVGEPGRGAVPRQSRRTRGGAGCGGFGPDQAASAGVIVSCP